MSAPEPPLAASRLSSGSRRVQFATALSGALEWYDFSCFGFMASEIGANFFNTGDQDSSLIAALGAFGGAFLARPIGGVLFGHLGDTGHCSQCSSGGAPVSPSQRRLRALEASLLVMLVPTVAIAVLPGQATLGSLAPLALLLVRLLQGLSVGGQLVGAVVTAAEKAPPGRETSTAAFVLAACNSGTLLGALVGALCHAAFSAEQMVAWAWRLPFAVGAALALVAYLTVRTLRARPEGGPRSAPPPQQPRTTELAAAAADCEEADGGAPEPPPLAASPLYELLRGAVGRAKLVACVAAWGAHTGL